MAKVTLFPDPPLGLRDGVRVAAFLDYFRDAGAESPVNPREGRPPALILHRVVKKCADGHILVRAVLEGEAGDAEEVGAVRTPCAFARLGRAEAIGADERSLESLRGGGRHGRRSSRIRWLVRNGESQPISA